MMKKISIVCCSLMITATASAQKPNWQNLDLQKDSVFGISNEKTYQEILIHKKKFRSVVVGVIDSGVDTAHEDLKAVIWINPKENYNGKDGDGDGHTGDIHGWDFIGGATGDIKQENLELTRLVRAGKADTAMMRVYQIKLKDDEEIVRNVINFESVLDSMVSKMKTDSPKLSDFENYISESPRQEEIRKHVVQVLNYNPDFNAYRNQRLINYQNHFQEELDYYLNPAFNPRSIVGDDTLNATEYKYGNHDVTGPTAFHGTHVAGIIAAVRDNNIGIQGIANHARVMSIRTVPDGDERDKDVANAIRYAADHGAGVINMSFGKTYSPDKKVVDDAVKYAMSKDVLIIHAAGNEGKNLDKEFNYPNKIYADHSGTAAAWIEVGASGWQDDSTLVASFSNYGQTSVDVFAPGVHIYSTVPGSKYEEESGTSMATPVVVGLATLLREYYPKLTALQVKEIIMKSVVKPAHDIQLTEDGKTKTIPFSATCVSGGIVNAYQAFLLAEKL